MSKVLCVKREDLAKEIPCVTNKYDPAGNFSLVAESNVGPVLSKLETFWVERQLAETSPEYLQIIPYITVHGYNYIYTYQRGCKSGEDRLKAKYSVGFGGHIDFETTETDPDTGKISKSLIDVVIDAATRELTEEIGGIPEVIQYWLSSNIDREGYGLIFDDRDSVGSVHLGVHLNISFRAFGELNRHDLKSAELDVVDNIKKLSPTEIFNAYRNGDMVFESWSQHVINMLWKKDYYTYVDKLSDFKKESVTSDSYRVEYAKT